ncbi:MAG: DUF5132 domain-containing protein [Sphingomonadaceae bacterium]
MASFLETLLGGAAAGAGFVLGVAAAMAGAQRSRPLLKQTMKSYLVAVDRTRELAAQMGETLEDLYAEAKAEYEAESKGAPPGTTTEG